MHVIQALINLSGIRVNVIWQKVIDSHLQVTKQIVRSPSSLRAVYLPWYINDEGAPTTFDDPKARPVTVGDVADNLEKWPERRDAIERYVAAYGVGVPTVPITLPAYRLPENRVLLLDGSHRAVALVLSGLNASVSILVIEGPNDPGFVPDLKHWQR